MPSVNRKQYNNSIHLVFLANNKLPLFLGTEEEGLTEAAAAVLDADEDWMETAGRGLLSSAEVIEGLEVLIFTFFLRIEEVDKDVVELFGFLAVDRLDFSLLPSLLVFFVAAGFFLFFFPFPHLLFYYLPHFWHPCHCHCGSL